MIRSWPKLDYLGLFIVLTAGALAGAVASAFRGLIERCPSAPVHLRDLTWHDFSQGRFALYGTGLALLFLFVWLLTGYYTHCRTNAPLRQVLRRNALCFPAGSPLAGALSAFGPADARPRFLVVWGLLYLVALAWMLPPFLKAVLSSQPVRRRDVLAAVLAVGLGLFLLDHPRPLDGDEPHYLVFAESLLRDGDADLLNNYGQDVTARFFRGPLDSTGHVVPALDAASGKHSWAPCHYPGLPALALPGYAVAGATGAKLVVTLLTAIGLTGIFALLRNLNVESVIAARAVIMLAVTAPFITYGLQLYPEMIAGAGLVWGIALLADREFRWPSALCVGMLAAALPWLHIRYAPLSAALILGAMVRCRIRSRQWPAVLLPIFLSAAGLLAYFHFVYGGFAPGRVSLLPANLSYWDSLSLRRSGVYLCAMFLDSAGGVFVYAPILMLAPLGVIRLGRTNRALAAAILLPILLEAGLIAAGWRSWHGDWSPPSRFMACVCPLIAALAVLGYTEAMSSTVLRWLCHGLFAAGILFGTLMIADPEAMYSMHFSGSVPALTLSYPWLPLGWFFPNYEDAGTRTVLLTLFWLGALSLLTWLSLRMVRRSQHVT